MLSASQVTSLRKDWARLLAWYGVVPVLADPVFDVLAAAYTAPRRHYHNLEHLAEMFRVVARLTPDTDDPGAVQLAVWFHDVVYDPRAEDNEPRSAEVLVELLRQLGVPPATVERVGRLVRATAHLSSADPPADRDTAALLDADLAILGADEERYRRYAADVREEYAFVPDEEYRKGRAAVLRTFLARPRIFHTRGLFDEAETRARANLAAELAELGG